MSENDHSTSKTNDKSLDRITIFNRLTLSEMNSDESQEKFKSLLTDAYPQFAEFCDRVINGADADQISNVTCYLENGCVIIEKEFTENVGLDIDNGVVDL